VPAQAEQPTAAAAAATTAVTVNGRRYDRIKFFPQACSTTVATTALRAA
jgi:hypothetical protein